MRLSDLIKEATRLIEACGDVKLIVFRDHESLDDISLSYIDYADAVRLSSDIELSWGWYDMNNSIHVPVKFSYSNKEITLNFPDIKDAPSTSKRMVFRIHGDVFFCDDVELQVYAGGGIIKGRVVSKC